MYGAFSYGTKRQIFRMIFGRDRGCNDFLPNEKSAALVVGMLLMMGMLMMMSPVHADDGNADDDEPSPC